MGFFSTVGSIAKGAVGSVKDMADKAEALAEGYRRESDDYLKRKMKGGSSVERIAAAKVLKERGG